jgi:hypothetical protein
MHHRRDEGQPIREAMDEAGLSITRLAKRTREIDPYGEGVSKSAIGSLVSLGTSGRENNRPRTAALVAEALGKPVKNLFDSDT